MTDLLRAAILGDHASVHMPTGVPDLTVEIALINPDDAAARVRAMLTSDEAVERAAKGAVASDSALKQWDDFGERGLVNAEEWMVSPETGRNWWRGIARAAILAAMGDPT